MKYKKIMVFGKPGSGKSTFANIVHSKTKLPLYHLDKYFFTNNWKERNYAEFMQIQQDIVNSESWIIDGNSTKSLETRYGKADLCLYFNLPNIICLWRIHKRLFQNRIHIDDRAEDCPEVINWSIIKYMWVIIP